MVIIKIKETNVYIDSSTTVSELPNGNIVCNNMAYPPTLFSKEHVEQIPETVEKHKYCYTEEKGFYPNPNWVEPKPYTQEQYDAVLENLIEEGRL